VSLPYVYTPRPGDRVTVRAAPGGRGCGLAVSTDLAAETGIPAADIPAVAAGIAAAMHEAAGLPAPIILERPKTLYPDISFGPELKVARGDAVTALWLGAEARTLGPDECRRLAAYLAICAEADEAAAADAEVDELARAIRSELYPPSESIGLRPGESDRTAARAALRWMTQKQQRGGAA